MRAKTARIGARSQLGPALWVAAPVPSVLRQRPDRGN